MSTETIAVGARVRGHDPATGCDIEGIVKRRLDLSARPFGVRWWVAVANVAPGDLEGQLVPLPPDGLVIPRGHQSAPKGLVYPPLEVVA